MTAVEIILFGIGAYLLVVGYRRTDRNKMLAAALLLLASAAISPFMEGFEEGFRESASRDRPVSPP